MSSILAEKGAEAATDLIVNAIGGNISCSSKYWQFAKKKLVKNLSSEFEKFFGFGLRPY